MFPFNLEARPSLEQAGLGRGSFPHPGALGHLTRSPRGVASAWSPRCGWSVSSRRGEVSGAREEETRPRQVWGTLGPSGAYCDSEGRGAPSGSGRGAGTRTFVF